MRALFRNLYTLPVELLYIDEPKLPKYMAGQDSPDRWIPVAPSGERLNGKSNMTFSSNGLFLECNYDSLHRVYTLGRGKKRVSQFRITDLNPSSTAARSTNRDLWIECSPPPDDEINDNTYEDIYILVERTSSKGIRGARLLITRQNRDKRFLKYDCPLRATIGPRPPSSWSDELHVPVFNKSEAAINVRLFLEHSKYSSHAVGRILFWTLITLD